MPLKVLAGFFFTLFEEGGNECRFVLVLLLDNVGADADAVAVADGKDDDSLFNDIYFDTKTHRNI